MGWPDSETTIISIMDSPSEQAVREQLRKLQTNRLFANSARLRRFLRFTVDQVLAGKQDELKEYVIGVEVYDRRASYHPTFDSIVRTEARRLRGKLKEYYEGDGKTDPVRIFFQPGNYIPEIHLQQAQGDASSGATRSDDLLKSVSSEVVISVDRFVDLSDHAQATICARGVTTELLHLLAKIEGGRVVVRAFPHSNPDPSDLRLDGDVRHYDGWLRITCRLTSAEGFQLASHRFDVSAEAALSFASQEEIAAILLSHIARHRSLAGKLTFPRAAGRQAEPSPWLEGEGHTEAEGRGRVISMVIPEKRAGTAVASS